MASSPAVQKDWHASSGALLLKAEKASDSLDRCLAVTRAILAFLSQLLRPGTRPSDIPVVVLGQHMLSHRDLQGILHRGDATRVYVQEIVAYDPVEAPVPTAPGPNIDVARMYVHATPHAKIKPLGKSRRSSGSGACVHVALEGGGSVEFARHDEAYDITSWPSLVLTPPTPSTDLDAATPPEWTMEWSGTLALQCGATGMRAELRFRPGTASPNVTGHVYRVDGSVKTPNARIEGDWTDRIIAHGLVGEWPTQGVVFDALGGDMGGSPPNNGPPTTIDLGRPGPRTVPRFWSAVIEAMLYADDDGKSVSGQLTASLTALLRTSLGFQSEKTGAQSASVEGRDDVAAAAAGDALFHLRPLPPAAKLERAAGKALKYQLQHVVQAVTTTALAGEAW